MNICITPEQSIHLMYACCCCRPTPPCLFGGVLPVIEVTGHPVAVSSLGLSVRIVDLELLYCLSFKDERAIQGQLPMVFLPMISVPDGGMCGRHW